MVSGHYRNRPSVSARIANHDELLNGALSSILCVGSGMYAVISGSAADDLWMHLVFLPLSPALGALGGFLRAQQHPRHGELKAGRPHLVIANGISLRYESLAIRISMRYVLRMIRSFKGKFAEPILQGRMVPKGFPANLAKVARRKLIMVDSADFLEALNSPPGNRLEALKGDLAGKHSIRINDQWRIVFRWTDAGPEDVEIIDYH